MDSLRDALRDAYVRGSMVPLRESRDCRIPSALNLTLCCIQASIALALLHAASQAATMARAIIPAIAFAFIMQAGFCLAHEAVHGKLLRNRRANVYAGILLFAFFPGSYHFFEIAHLVHHHRNRSDAELEDYVLDGENAMVKRVCYYLLICGLFWLLVPLCSLAAALTPARRASLPPPGARAGQFRRFAQFVNDLRLNRVRRDVAIVILFWLAAAPLLHLTWRGVALCYAAFAFSWASQQYIYHVRTPRHAVLGSLDLHLPRPMELFYLNFNYHLTHHLAVWVPWIYLNRLAPERPSLGYIRTYLQLWRPPERIEAAWPDAFQTTGAVPAREEAAR